LWIPEAPESEPCCNLVTCTEYKNLLTANVKLNNDNAELTEAIKKGVDDRDEVYAENELLKAQMETMTKVTYAGEVAILTEQIKRYKEFERRVRCHGDRFHGAHSEWIFSALSDK